MSRNIIVFKVPQVGTSLVAQWLSLLLLLSCFSHVQLCETPQTAAHQAPPSLGFSRQEIGILQCMKVKSESEVAQSCPTLSDPMDCSLPGSCVHGIFQARVLEWGAIAFSEWLSQCTPNAGGLGSIPSQGTRSHIQLKIQHPESYN